MDDWQGLQAAISEYFWALSVADARRRFGPIGYPFDESWFQLFEEDPGAAWSEYDRRTVNIAMRAWRDIRVHWPFWPSDHFERLLNLAWAYHNRIDAMRLAPLLPRLARMDSAHAFATIMASDFPSNDDGTIELPADANPVKAGRNWYERLRSKYRDRQIDFSADHRFDDDDWTIFLLNTFPAERHRPRKH